MNFRLVFRIFYTFLFTLLNIVLLGLLFITPADAIKQALDNGQNYNVIVIATCYFATVLLAIIIYASRLYTNRSVLAAIPKTWVPVEKGDINKKVRKMIVASLSRSAAIAWDSRPRMPSELPTTIVSEPEQKDPVTAATAHEKKRFLHKRRSNTEKDDHIITIPPHPPVWGDIMHEGWSPPTSPDLPNLQYSSVISELPHLIEARAVSLAPPDPTSTSDPPKPDMEAVFVLQRSASIGLRDYISHLISIGTISRPEVALKFLGSYEYARFSRRPLNEAQFRDLMSQFAELLRSMTTFNLAELETYEEEEEEEKKEEEEEEEDQGSDIDDDASPSTTHRSRSFTSIRSGVSRTGSEGTVRTSRSRRTGTNGTSTARGKFSTAPATPVTPRSRKRIPSSSPSTTSFSQSRRPYVGGASSSGSSMRSTSQGSVIRLSRSNESSELPYTLTLPGAR